MYIWDFYEVLQMILETKSKLNKDKVDKAMAQLNPQLNSFWDLQQMYIQGCADQQTFYDLLIVIGIRFNYCEH